MVNLVLVVESRKVEQLKSINLLYLKQTLFNEVIVNNISEFQFKIENKAETERFRALL